MQKLYGNKREIIRILATKPYEEAMSALFNKYAIPNGFTAGLSLKSIRNELAELEAEKFLTVSWRGGGLGICSIRVLPKCNDYFEMEYDFEKRLAKGNGIVFNRLYGESERLILCISKLSEKAAMDVLAERYGGTPEQCRLNKHRITLAVHHGNPYDLEIEELITENYYDNRLQFDGGYYITLTDKHNKYPSMKADHDAKNRPAPSIYAPDNKGNISVSGGDMHNITQTNTTGVDLKEIFELIATMKTLAQTLNDEEIRANVIDDLDILQEQAESSSPRVSRIKKAMQSIENALLPIKSATTVSTLLVHLSTLAPLAAMMTGGA